MFSAVKPLINREIFLTITKLFFPESPSFSCEKTTMKITGPVNELFFKVCINLKQACSRYIIMMLRTWLTEIEQSDWLVNVV